jgi:hypothetical protein
MPRLHNISKTNFVATIKIAKHGDLIKVPKAGYANSQYFKITSNTPKEFEEIGKEEFESLQSSNQQGSTQPLDGGRRRTRHKNRRTKRRHNKKRHTKRRR